MSDQGYSKMKTVCLMERQSVSKTNKGKKKLRTTPQNSTIVNTFLSVPFKLRYTG